MNKIDSLVKDCDKLAARMDALNKRADACFSPKRADASKHDPKYSTAEGQKMLMAKSVGLPEDTYTRKIKPTAPGKDYGADPLGNGKFRMVPSGDIVDYEERMRRLPMKKF